MALKYSTFESLFSAIAEAIRFQEQTSNEIIADNFPNRNRNRYFFRKKCLCKW